MENYYPIKFVLNTASLIVPLAVAVVAIHASSTTTRRWIRWTANTVVVMALILLFTAQFNLLTKYMSAPTPTPQEQTND